MLSLDDYEDSDSDLNKIMQNKVGNPDFSIMVLADAVLNENDSESTENSIRRILKNWDEFKNRPNIRNYQYHIKDAEKLKELIKKVTSVNPNADLNWIDVSSITDMSYLFFDSPFIGDISRWDVSNVTSMCNMFCKSKFNGDISHWDVSNVINMTFMFHKSKFNKDIRVWQINPDANTYSMFMDSAIDNSKKPNI